jgi:hypothetical protein
MKKITTLFILVFCIVSTVFAQRQVEQLGRGLVAVNVADGVFLSWRMFATDARDDGFNLYRDGQKINSTPITGATNYTDSQGTTSSTYTVHPVVDGVEQSVGGSASVWDSQVLTVNLQRPSTTHQPNDCSIGDLDGDGEYEIIVKWYPDNAKDNSQSGYTDNTYLDAYKLDGTFLWRIDLGVNIRSGAHYTQFLVADYDLDGYAEVACKTAPGTIDGAGDFIHDGPAASADHSADYRNSGGYILTGPEYLTIFNGKTGAEMATIDYVPLRGNVGSWGDDYGNRVDRFNATNAYLDGSKQSMVFQRGYYTRMVIAAFDWDGQTLSHRWTFDSNDSGNGALYGNGNHSIMAADSDGDGFDEIFTGSGAIDHDGSFMWCTGYGHGDANHISDLNPDRPGLEIWQVSENKGSEPDHYMIDAATGEVIWGEGSGSDNGRGMTGDIDANTRGQEAWSNSVAGTKSCTGTTISNSKGSSNFRVYWDGDLQDELLDGNKLDKWTGNGISRLITLEGWACNGSKNTPNLSADLIGDWREEVVLHYDDVLLISTTTIPTEHKLYTLMHDPVYKNAISWQQSSYNQPPHLGFYLADGVENAPVPEISYVSAGFYNLPEGVYTFSALHSGLCISATDDFTQQTCNEGDVNQTWIVEKVDSYYHFYSVGAEQYLTYSAAENEAEVGFGAGSNMDFVFQEYDDGSLAILPALNTDKAVDVYNISTDVGAFLSFWDTNDGEWQRFMFTPVDDLRDCNGDWNGTAYYDDCGVCVEGNTGLSPCIAHESEDISEFLGVFESTNTGFSGTGYVNTDNVLDSYITFYLNAEQAVNLPLTIRYANGSTDNRDASVSVNNAEIIANTEFPNTGAWTSWNTKEVNMSLNQGVNIITFTATTANGLANFDQIWYYDPTVTIASAEDTVQNQNQQEIHLRAGWNMVGYPLVTKQTVESALTDIWTQVEVVKDMSGFYLRNQDPSFNSLTEMEWGKGYLIKVDADCVIIW